MFRPKKEEKQIFFPIFVLDFAASGVLVVAARFPFTVAAFSNEPPIQLMRFCQSADPAAARHRSAGLPTRADGVCLGWQTTAPEEKFACIPAP
jgi:hypothetical protein